MTNRLSTNRRLCRTLISLALVCCGVSWGDDEADGGRPGTVQLSSGELLDGRISTTPGRGLQLQVGDDLKELALEAVQELRFTPEQESLEQKWRFVEAGRTEKKKWGLPYPIRELRTTLLLAGGNTLSGHLYTTVFYIQQPEQTTKIVVKAKDKGTAGQTLKDVVYPVRIAFADSATALPGDVRLEFGPGSAAAEVVVLAEGSLLRLEAKPDPAGNGRLRLPALTEPRAFAALRRGEALVAGWPAAPDTEGIGRIERALVDVEDFFDSRKVLGVWKADGALYSLLMLRRLGHTTLDGEKTQPWRLEVWRWKEADGKLMLAGRGYFFRGILTKTAEPPPVTLEPRLWQLNLKGTVTLP